TPTCGPSGTVVTITGIQFTGATAVSFNGKAATTFTVDSYTQIRATVPTGATTGKISVTTGLGTGVSQNSFAIPATPVVTSFSPTSGPVGTVVTITGNNFTCITSVFASGSAHERLPSPLLFHARIVQAPRHYADGPVQEQSGS